MTKEEKELEEKKNAGTTLPNTEGDATNTDAANTESTESDNNDTLEGDEDNVFINGYKFAKDHVKDFNVSIYSSSYHISEDEDKADTYGWQIDTMPKYKSCDKTIWGSKYDEATQSWTPIEHANSVVASSYGINAVVDHDPILKYLFPVMVQDAKDLSKTEWDKIHKNKYDKMMLKMRCIRVDAHTPFINPYTRVANPKPVTFEKDYVFAYLLTAKFSAKNPNHKQILKKIFDENFDIMPEDFVDFLVDEHYFIENVDDELRERLYKTMAYTKNK